MFPTLGRVLVLPFLLATALPANASEFLVKRGAKVVVRSGCPAHTFRRGHIRWWTPAGTETARPIAHVDYNDEGRIVFELPTDRTGSFLVGVKCEQPHVMRLESQSGQARPAAVFSEEMLYTSLIYDVVERLPE